MQGIKVRIAEYVDDSNPGWVRVVFTDVHGNEWSIIEKVSVVTTGFLDKNSQYPVDGFIAGAIVKQFVDGNGRDVITIDLSQPWCVSTLEGKIVFNVFQEQVVAI